MASSSTRPRLILVHGAWVGPWEFAPIVPVLEADGWEVDAITLPSVGSTEGLLADAAAVTVAIERAGGPVVLVAHSYGGIPVTQAGDHPSVERIVYVTAFAVDAGESLLDVMGGTQPEWWGVADGQVEMGRTRDERVEMLAADMPPGVPREASEQLADMFRPQSLESFTTGATQAAWKTRPTTYIVTENDAVIPPFVQESLAARSGADVIRVPHGHAPFQENPVAFAALLAQVATQ